MKNLYPLSSSNGIRLLMLLLILAFVALGSVIYWQNKNLRSTTYWVSHTYEVIHQVELVKSAAKDIQLATRGYRLTSDPLFVARLREKQVLILDRLAKLELLTRDNRSQQKRIDVLKNLVKERIMLSNLTVNKVSFSEDAILFGESLMSKLSDITKLIRAEEERLMIIRREANFEREVILNRLTNALFVFASIALLIAFYLAYSYRKYKNNTVELIKGLNARLEDKLEVKTKEADELLDRYKIVFENLHEGACVLDFEERHLYANKVFLERVGVTLKEFVGKTPSEFNPGIELTEPYKLIQRCLKKRMAATTETEYMVHNGEIRYYSLGIQAVSEGVLLLSQDITDRKKRELEKEAQIEKLEEVLFKISHEVRHPVVQLMGISTLFEQSLVSDEDFHDMIGHIRQSTDQLDVYTRDLTKFVDEIKTQHRRNTLAWP